MADTREMLHGFKPVMVMVLVEIAYAGMNVFYKLAVNDGMNLKVLVTYQMIFATAFVLVLALIFERIKGSFSRPKLTWMVLFQAFLCGLFGGLLTQNLYIKSLSLTSTAYVSAMDNLIPAFTFVLAICFRMEKLGIERLSGKAKVLGTLLGIGGAMLLTFYKGPEISIWSTHINLLHQAPQNSQMAAAPENKFHSHLLGFFSALASCFSYAIWLIVQTKMSEKYSYYFSSTALMSLMGSIQCAIFALCTDGYWQEWKLGWNIRLYTTLYSGIVGSGLVVALISWCIVIRGPVFVSVFNPLALLLVTLAGSFLLDEKLHFGSIVGAVFIICGLYMVLWGNGKETKEKTDSLSLQNSQKSELNAIDIDGKLKLDAATAENEGEIVEIEG